MGPAGNLHRKVRRTVSNVLIISLYRTAYITGLAILIPMVFVNGLENGLWYSSALLYILLAAVFVLFAVAGVIRKQKNIPKALKSLGLMSLIPGAAAFAFFIFGKDAIYSLAASFVPAFAEIEPWLNIYLGITIPQIGLLAAGYVLVGAALYMTGRRLSGR